MDAVDSLGPIRAVPLSHDRFLETHVAFETSSTQQDQIRQTLAAERLPGVASVLSVGCGSGILDAPLAERLSHGRRLRYVGVEPNPIQSAAFEAQLLQLPVDGQVVTATFEAYAARDVVEHFDLVLLIHTHYYLRDVPDGLARAAALLQPGGKLLVAAAPRGALNVLAEAFWPAPADDGLWFSEQLSAHLEQRGVAAPSRRIEGRLNVTPCFEGTPLGDAIRDFVVQADTRAMPIEVRNAIDEALRGMAREEANGRWTVPHPVDLFEIAAAKAEALAA